MPLRLTTLTSDLRVVVSDYVCSADVAAAFPRVEDMTGVPTAS